jgi:hypothetical protein
MLDLAQLYGLGLIQPTRAWSLVHPSDQRVTSRVHEETSELYVGLTVSSELNLHMYNTHVIIIAKEREMKSLPVQGGKVEDGGLLWIPLFLLPLLLLLVFHFLGSPVLSLSLCTVVFLLFCSLVSSIPSLLRREGCYCYSRCMLMVHSGGFWMLMELEEARSASPQRGSLLLGSRSVGCWFVHCS